MNSYANTTETVTVNLLTLCPQSNSRILGRNVRSLLTILTAVLFEGKFSFECCLKSEREDQFKAAKVKN
jgi:hypothetical protein